MRSFLQIFLFFITATVNGQTKADETDVKGLAAYFSRMYANDEARVRAAYHWVTTNISYNTDSAVHINWSLKREEQLQATMRRRKGVCENYAVLFSALLEEMNIRSYIVRGEALVKSTSEHNAHSWVAVYMHNNWAFYDPTWDAGSNNYRWFAIAPASFISTHLPFDPLWQLLPETTGNKNKLRFNALADSVDIFLSLDSLRQFEAIERRMQLAGVTNSVAQNWYDYNKMHVHLQKEHTYLYLFDRSTEYLNKTVKAINHFKNLWNSSNGVIHNREEERRNLDMADTYLQMARLYADKLAEEKDNYQYDPAYLVEQCDKLANSLADQKALLK